MECISWYTLNFTSSQEGRHSSACDKFMHFAAQTYKNKKFLQFIAQILQNKKFLQLIAETFGLNEIQYLRDSVF